ncbi:MAG TPA: LamG-like jellyroll fold domain-containing protein [Verrucomicrobiae bacterium]|nr:LamG-like jellyroll fold domain-containing protein [Verrucomicrobiae bacterium]
MKNGINQVNGNGSFFGRSCCWMAATVLLLGGLGAVPRAGAASCLQAPSGLISWWPGDGNALDITSTNNGTLQGGATDTAVGEVGQAFSFNGSTSYVSIPDSAALRPTNLTVEAWVLFNSLNSTGNSAVGQQYIVFKQNTRSGNFEGYYLGKERGTGGDHFVFAVSSSAGASVEADSGLVIATNVWYYVAGVRGSNFVQLYLNGQMVGQTTVTFAQNYGTEPLFFGSSGESYWDGKLSGMLDEVSLYNRALGSNEIAAIFTAGSAGKCKSAQPPTVTVVPASQTVALGGTAVFTANAGGTPPFGYQWQFAGAPIAGATAVSLAITNVQTTNAGSYTVVVTNSVTAVTSLVATLSVAVPPVITLQPVGSINLVGSTATFTGAATGTLPLNYQWTFNGVDLVNGGRISGANTNSLTIVNVQPGDTGNYIWMVSNAAGTTNAIPAMLTVNGPPVINAQPVSQIVAPGTLVTFSVSATGTAPLGYQWQFNGTPLTDGNGISGSVTAVLSLSSAQTNNAGTYSVTVTNALGTTNSGFATLGFILPGSCDSAPSGLVGWWPGDGNANDVTGANNGTLQGGATANAPGEDGPAFNFDGANGYVSIPDSAALRPTNLTVEAWVLFNSLNSVGNASPGQEYIVFKQNTRSGNFEGYYLGKERGTGGDHFVFTVSSSAGASSEADSAPVIATNVWYHVAGVRGSNFVQLYLNGQMVAQSAVTFPQNYGTEPLFFGTSGESYWDGKLAGYLDEVALYNRALASNEIAAIYAAGSAGKCKAAAAPTIAGQPASQIITVNGTVSFNVVVAGSTPILYQWYKDGVKLANNTDIFGATGPTLTIQNLQLTDIGNYDVIVANSLGSATSTVASLNTGIPPANDNFVNAQAISGSSGSVTGNNADGSKEPGEPNHAGNPGGASIWYTWTAPSTSPVTFDTCLSAFDTLLAVYTGNTVTNLTLIASNDDATTNCNRSRLTFTPVTGTVYHIAVDGKNGANGNLTLRWAQATVPLPDLSLVASAVNPMIVTNTFAPTSCAVEEGLIQAGTRTIIRFSTQTENSGTADMIFGNPADNPLFVWAPCHAHYHFQNYMSYRLLDSNGHLAAIGLKVGFCVLDVFRWSPTAGSTAIYSCTDQGIQVGWGDLYDSTLDGQWIDITGLPNGNYTMELEANPQGIIQEADYTNNVIHVPIAIGNPSAPPLNDNFANAQALLGGFATVPGNTANATKEAGEPNHAGNVGGHSIWYTWTSPSTKAVTIDTINSSFNTLLAVYTGTSLNNLALVASNDDIAPGFLQSRVTFNATAGTTYQIAVDGYNGASGSVVLTLNQTLQNDNFVNAESIGGVSGVVYGSTSGATKEPGEPNHAGNPGGNSIWYYWTAPISGTATFNTFGSQFSTLLAVYTGSVVSNLTPVASDAAFAPPSNVQSSVTFSAIGLTRYDIAIDGFNGANGDSTLNWNLAAGAGPLVAGGVRFGLAAITPQVTTGFLPEGEFQLNISGLPLQNYRIQESCDLQHWASIVTTLADERGYASFTDKTTMRTTGQPASQDALCGAGQAAGLSGPRARFYRAIPTAPN